MDGPSPERQFELLLQAMKRAVGVLREAGVKYALAGGLASWAYGGPESDHDVDLFLTQEEAERALTVLAEAGFRPERSPEGWLYKVYDDNEAMIDLIFGPSSGPVDEEMIARAEEREVYAVRMPVLSPTDIVRTKLLALKEHNLDYDGALSVARSLREQIDWQDLWHRTSHSPYARPFFVLAEGLGVGPAGFYRVED